MADDLAALERDLEQAAARFPAEARKVVSKGALNIKNDWREAWDDLDGHAKRIHHTIGYDMSPPGGDEIIAIIGPDVNRQRMQGALGGIIEFGVPGKNTPNPGGAVALVNESPRFEEALGDLGERLLDGRSH